MNNKEKISHLISKGLNHGDEVYFTVENQSQYIGPSKGILCLSEHDPHIMCAHKDSYVKVNINDDMGACINTIQKP